MGKTRLRLQKVTCNLHYTAYARAYEGNTDFGVPSVTVTLMCNRPTVGGRNG